MGGEDESVTWSAETRRRLSERGYSIGRQIGYGSYSTVYRGKKGNLDIAIKVIDLKKASPSYRDKFFPREFNMIRRIQHKYIILTYDIYREQDPKNGLDRAFIFMELAETDLLSVIEKRGKIEEVQSRVWFHEVFQGVAYLHSRQYSHRDLKVENVLISRDRVAMVSDFGFVKESLNRVSSTFCGSVQYAAPEIVINTPYDPFAADVWSLGICLFASLTGHMPFQHHPLHLLKTEQKNIQRTIATVNVSHSARDLLSHMLQYREKDRIKMKDAVTHHWFEGRK